MTKLLLTLFLGATFLFANKFYDISDEEYIKYQNDPEKMLELFKRKYASTKKAEKKDHC